MVAVILCADDYGMSQGVSRGILDCALAGRITAASAMTALPDWPRAAQAWTAAAPDADLGLHLTLTLGQPLGPMPAFAPDGAFPPLGALIRRRDLPLGEIENEFVRQIDGFAQHAGRLPVHVDGHQHVHALPGVRDALFRALARTGCRPALVRDSGDRGARILARGGAIVKATLVAGFSRGFAEAARAAGHRCNDGFAGFSPFDPAADLSRQFARYFRSPGDRHLVMCHPGLVDDGLRALDPVTDAREAERAFLLSPAFIERLTVAGVTLAKATAA